MSTEQGDQNTTPKKPEATTKSVVSKAADKPPKQSGPSTDGAAPKVSQPADKPVASKLKKNRCIGGASRSKPSVSRRPLRGGADQRYRNKNSSDVVTAQPKPEVAPSSSPSPAPVASRASNSSRHKARQNSTDNNRQPQRQSNRHMRSGPRNRAGFRKEHANYQEETESIKTSDTAKTIDIRDLKSKPIGQLQALAKEANIDASRMRKAEIIFSLLKDYANNGDILWVSHGVLEILPDGYGFLRSLDASYLAGADDIYVSPNQIRRYHLRTGDMIAGRIRPPKEQERYFALFQVSEINYDKPESMAHKSAFENLTPLFPDEMINLEIGNGSTEDLAPRVVQAFCPIGKGQRGLIVSPPKAGKTMMLQSIAHSISANHPECHLIVLLIDERPEEVTEMARSVKGEVVASTFDEPATRHVQVAEMVIERARRLVEHKRDVVILLDSITRLARAYNTVIPSSGKVLTGGVDANALQRPKHLFGAARNVEEGGSLTIIATALVDTGSRMDEVIFEEFKGTGNMEVHLDRRIAEKRVYPAININRSGTRREELMRSPEELRRTWIIRKVLHPMDEISAAEFLLERMRQCKTNADFFDAMRE